MRVKRTDQQFDINRQWMEDDGVTPRNITGYTITLYLTERGSGAITSIVATHVDSVQGKFKFIVPVGFFNVVTSYEAEIEFVTGGQTIQTTHFEIVVEENRTGTTTPLYCTVQDVADFMNIEIDIDTKPSYDQVEKIILYKQGDIERETGHAWRERSVSNETHDIEGEYRYAQGFDIKLYNRLIKTFDYSKGDRIQYFDANNWVDLLTADNSIATNVIIDYTNGIVSFRGFVWSWIYKRKFRFSYRFGEGVIPDDVRELCVKMTAIELINTSLFYDHLPYGGDRKTIDATIREWREDVENKLQALREYKAIY